MYSTLSLRMTSRLNPRAGVACPRNSLEEKIGSQPRVVTDICVTKESTNRVCRNPATVVNPKAVFEL